MSPGRQSFRQMYWEKERAFYPVFDGTRSCAWQEHLATGRNCMSARVLVDTNVLVYFGTLRSGLLPA